MPENLFEMARLPGIRSVDQSIKQQTQLRIGNISPPRLVEGADGVSTSVFEDKPHVMFRQIQNLCAFPVKIAYNTDADENFHAILAACSATDDGLGSVINVPQKCSVNAAAVGGALRLATIEIFAPEAGIN